ncbi:hypothetical protein [Martelella mediterranea]|uniref:Uncharacterized protein n=1 Tax=Martelella mediterranea TaxID=293089 RepID=A0A4R3NPM6_9HYPH|nr:hypothetical protein [Martelella mediterranea]TCT37698.1 hypothetical protein EDC90_101788 [Martelella mediterranea]
MKRPNKGGCYIRDPKTKALRPVAKEPPQSAGDPEPTVNTAETTNTNAASKNATGKGK